MYVSAEEQNGLQKWGENLSAKRLVVDEADSGEGSGLSLEDGLRGSPWWGRGITGHPQASK